MRLSRKNSPGSRKKVYTAQTKYVYKEHNVNVYWILGVFKAYVQNQWEIVMPISLNQEQLQQALEAMRAYLTAPPTTEGRKPVEADTELDQQRITLIEGELKPLTSKYLSNQITLVEFKTKVDSINERNQLWGIKGQMFFNLILNVADDENECDQELKTAIALPANEEIASSRIKTFASYIKRIGEQHVEAGGSKHGKLNVSSVPFFLSNFWRRTCANHQHYRRTERRGIASGTLGERAANNDVSLGRGVHAPRLL